MTVYCCSCHCPLESEVCEYDALQEERERDPSIGWVQFLCQLCQEVLCLEHPEWPLLPNSESPTSPS